MKRLSGKGYWNKCAGISISVCASLAVMQSADAQASSDGISMKLIQELRTGQFLAANNTQVVNRFRQLPPQAYIQLLQYASEHYKEAEFWIRRQERLETGWTERPYVNFIKYRQTPRQIYIKWLEGGPDMGQEVLYDETSAPDEVIGRLAGLITEPVFHLSVQSDLLKLASNHSIKEFGLPYLAEVLRKDVLTCQYTTSCQATPSEVRITQEGERRMISITWVWPQGRPTFYGKKMRIAYELNKLYPSVVEVWRDAIQMQERLWIDKALARKWSSDEFALSNPEYRFERK